MPPTVLTLFAALALPFLASAQESAAHAQKARAAWSAFECTALASQLERTADQERLFKYGYRQGREYIAALQAGKIKQEDLAATVPIGLTLVMQGPTPDFMLGRIFEAATTNALQDVFRQGDRFRSADEKATAAADKFTSRNCQLIGNG